MSGENIEELFQRYGPAYRWLVTIAGLLGGFAMVLSSTISNVAVPEVMGAFGIGQDEAQWMSTAFLATMTASQLLNAWMVNAFGQRGAFMITIMIFIVGMVLSGTAPNIDVLILGRVLQGFSAGVVQPLTMVTIFQVFPADRRGLAMGIYGTGMTLAPGIGPLFGGLAIDEFSWHFVFFLPLPFCVLALAMGWLFMPARRGAFRFPPFDWPGLLLLATGLVFLLAAGARGPREGWDANVIVSMFVIGGIGAVGFILRQGRSAAPLLDFGMYANPQFTAAVVVAFVFGIGNFATSYIIPVFVQTVQGYTPGRAGLVLLPAGLLLCLAMPIAGRFADRIPYHVAIMIGLVLFAAGSLLMVDSDVNTPFWTFAIHICISRIGMAFILPSLNAAALRALPVEQLNRGSGNVNFIRQLGGAVGVNGTVLLLSQRIFFHSDEFTATQTAANTVTQEWLNRFGTLTDQAGIPDAQHGLAYDYMAKVLYAQASTLGFQDAFLALGLVFLLALVPAWMLGRTRARA